VIRKDRIKDQELVEAGGRLFEGLLVEETAGRVEAPSSEDDFNLKSWWTVASRRGVTRARKRRVSGVARRFQITVIVDPGPRDEVSRGPVNGA